VAYLSAVDTLVKVAFTVVPILLTAARITIEMPAAIIAYSMAVTPELSFKKWPTSLHMTGNHSLVDGTESLNG
jgi:hypothetical protein